MVEHDELMRRAVAGVRASRSPTSEAQARVFAALERRLGGPLAGVDASDGVDTVGPAPASTVPVTIDWVAKVIGATVSLTAAGLLLLRIAVGAVQTTTVDGEPRRDERTVSDTVDVVDVADTSVLRDHASEPMLEAVPVKPARTPVPAMPSPEPPELAPANTLAAELALVGAAKRASTPDAALMLLDQHAREYPSGVMASEREALAVVALCQLDRTGEARARARVLIAERPGLPLLQGMRRDCPALADLLRQLPP
jgi:hypothetical protein